ncbi:MAG: EAL domain-containing response regulator [Clostridia bacterium]|nr:EAL domain-containing response regulator [Deltaproteobacteria bacterium]
MTSTNVAQPRCDLRDGTYLEDVSRRVLMVDDDADFLRSMRRLLESEGWSVTILDSPSQGLDLLSLEQFAVVLADFEMPGMDGVQFLSRVRKSAPYAIRVLVTGNSDFQVAVDAVNEGHIFRFVPKSSSRDGVVNAVREAASLFSLRRAERNAESERRTESVRNLESQFEDALAGLWMAYQPIVFAEGNRVIAYEALMRSTSKDLGNPGLILDAAERLDAVEVLGRTVRQLVSNQLVQDPSIQVFINLHALELLDDALYDPNAPLTRHASRVVLEITERVALTQVADIRDRLHRLRGLGFRIAVDDLGAGYAGLGSLVDLEPEVVKLDMGLVRNVHESPTKQKLVRAIAALGRELGWLLVAEGVETEVERSMLLNLGCDVLQGYLIGRPAPMTTTA